MIIATLTRSVFLISLIVIIGFALYPDLQLPSHWPAGQQSDRFYHVLAFSGLSFLAGFAWRLSPVLVFGLIVIALTLELAQVFSPGREPDGLDLGASLLGVGLGLSLVCVSNRIRRWRSRPS